MLTQNGKIGATPNPGCLESRETPGVFLRLHTPREQIAPPYASLVKLSLKLDETTLELSFVTHRVTITGKNLSEIYTAIAEVEARIITVISSDFADETRIPSYRSLVRGLRIDPLHAEEKRKR